MAVKLVGPSDLCAARLPADCGGSGPRVHTTPGLCAASHWALKAPGQRLTGII